ncbi:MAG TPA: trypsin-like serine protease [Treponema sp.]|nr:trypsin-like serine protease [Treponema sp.]
MRLYSKHQVAGLVLIAISVTLIGSFILGGVVLPKNENSVSISETDASMPLIFHENIPAGSLTANEQNTFTLDENQNITVYEKANEAVVNITTEVVGINWFLEPVPQEGGSGSGSIIDTRGYVVTNSHVISNAVKIYLSLSDGSQYEGTVVGVDSENDIAVLKFEPPKEITLTTIPFGTSHNLRVGQKVLAIGNPFGLERTLTTGIVSALGRPIKTSSNTIIRDMIQTDTAINPGNSGGPLLDTAGRMIGINTMIYSTSGSSAGVGFAVPVDTAKRVVSELIQYGKVRRGTIDAEFVQLNSSIANYAKLSTNRGLLVSRVGSGSNAEKAGLKGGENAVRYGSGRSSSVIYLGGDILLAIDEQPVESLADYYAVLEAKKPGESVSVTVLRAKKQLNLTVQLVERTR